MNTNEFYETVKQMRFAQIRSSRTQKKEDIEMCKSLEKIVDFALVSWQEQKFQAELSYKD
ncbi:hypothetical protein [Treponema pectinovorum]|uniref:hypothetical protein n=1 Tax=Treponema pectinovorum TaxID=164 RepID=UPI0011CC3B90|nr:hypothetical protein [Treponema pectinovorum]